MTAFPHRAHAPRHAGRRTWLARAATAMTLVVASLFVTGVAYAVWTSRGTGAGTASTGTVTLTASAATAASGLAPGRSATSNITVTTTSTRSLTITAVQFGAAVVDTAHTACTSSNVSATVTLSSPLPTVAAGQPVTLIASVALDANAPSVCQGATFTIPSTVTGRLG